MAEAMTWYKASTWNGITEVQATKETPKSLKINGNLVRKHSSSVSYFLERDHAINFLVDYWNRKLDSAKRNVRRVENELKALEREI